MDAERRIAHRCLNPEQRRRIAQRCENSGLSRWSDFARRYRIPLSNQQRWMRELQCTPKEVPAVVFREVAVPPPLRTAATPVWAIEIVGPDGTTIRFCEDRSILSKLHPRLDSPRLPEAGTALSDFDSAGIGGAWFPVCRHKVLNVTGLRPRQPAKDIGQVFQRIDAATAAADKN